MNRLAQYVAAMLTLMVIPLVCFSGETLKEVRSKGVLSCGVSEGLPGFSIKDANGRWTFLAAWVTDYRVPINHIGPLRVDILHGGQKLMKNGL